MLRPAANMCRRNHDPKGHTRRVTAGLANEVETVNRQAAVTWQATTAGGAADFPAAPAEWEPGQRQCERRDRIEFRTRGWSEDWAELPAHGKRTSKVRIDRHQPQQAFVVDIRDGTVFGLFVHPDHEGRGLVRAPSASIAAMDGVRSAARKMGRSSSRRACGIVKSQSHLDALQRDLQDLCSGSRKGSKGNAVNAAAAPATVNGELMTVVPLGS